MTIKAIIFDLGGVLLRTADFSPREQLAVRLGMSRHELEEFIFGGESGNRAQRGEISVKEHWENLQKQINCSPRDFKALVDEFFAQDELDLELVDYIRKLHRHYRTALLSNAWDDLRQIISERWHCDDAFDTIVISSEVGVVKPEPQIFLLTLDRLGVKANQAVFVDDMQPNIDGAKLVGLHGIRFRTLVQMRDELEQLLNSY